MIPGASLFLTAEAEAATAAGWASVGAGFAEELTACDVVCAALSTLTVKCLAPLGIGQTDGAARPLRPSAEVRPDPITGCIASNSALWMHTLSKLHRAEGHGHFWLLFCGDCDAGPYRVQPARA
mmetsp:Transcript_7341/g.12669  ORF Transcript_7341/g.12669 Transcript_7341/m.12669 type:complete len:124 (-) Transcript_7341:42-413(-)